MRCNDDDDDDNYCYTDWMEDNSTKNGVFRILSLSHFFYPNPS